MTLFSLDHAVAQTLIGWGLTWLSCCVIAEKPNSGPSPGTLKPQRILLILNWSSDLWDSPTAGTLQNRGQARFPFIIHPKACSYWDLLSLSLSLASQVALVVKNPPASAGDIRDMGSISGSGRSPGGRHGNPLQYSCLENPMDRRAWWVTVCRVSESDMTEVT